MTERRGSKPEQGFTLVEVLVAAMILGKLC